MLGVVWLPRVEYGEYSGMTSPGPSDRSPGGPSLDELEQALLAAAGTEGPHDPVSISLTLGQAQRLARRLGWRPTPSSAACRDGDGRFCCPTCAATSELEDKLEVLVRIREVRPVHTGGQIGIVVGSDADDDQEGEWWLRCRRCGLEFNPPEGLAIAGPGLARAETDGDRGEQGNEISSFVDHLP